LRRICFDWGENGKAEGEEGTGWEASVAVATAKTQLSTQQSKSKITFLLLNMCAATTATIRHKAHL
jgi:hypothetical protein